jgi:hypothetical protein
MGSKPKAVRAPEMDIAGDIQKYVSGMSSALPEIFSQEQQFRPQFQGLNLGDIQSFLSGAGGQQGIFGLSREASQQAGMGLGEARAAELGQMTGQAGLTRGLMQALSPEQAAVVQGFGDEAQRAYAASQRISPQEQRGYQQSAREAASAAGRLGGNAAIASEVMGREDVFARKRAEAAQAGRTLTTWHRDSTRSQALAFWVPLQCHIRPDRTNLVLGLVRLAQELRSCLTLLWGLTLVRHSEPTNLRQLRLTHKQRLLVVLDLWVRLGALEVRF